MTLVLALCLITAAASRAPAFESDLEADVHASTTLEYLDAWEKRTTVTDYGTWNTSRAAVDEFVRRWRLDGEIGLRGNIREDTILDLDIDFDVDATSLHDVELTRFDRIRHGLELSLTHGLRDGALLDVALFHEGWREELEPAFAPDRTGARILLEKRRGRHAFLTLEGRYVSSSEATETGGGWDFDEYRLAMSYRNVTVPRTRPPLLDENPSAPRFHRERAGGCTLYPSTHERHKRGLERLLAMLDAPDDLESPGPPEAGVTMRKDTSTWLRTDLYIREYEHIADQSMFGAFLGGGASFALSRKWRMKVEDSIGLRRYDHQLDSIFMLDNCSNDFHATAEFSYGPGFFSLECGLKTTIYDDAEGLDFNRWHAALSWNYYDGKRFSYALWSRYMRHVPMDPGVENPEQGVFDCLASFILHLGPDERTRFSYGRTRNAVYDYQVGTNSSFIVDEWRMEYQRRLRAGIRGTLGWRYRRERHEHFHENDSDERSITVELETSL